jgi:hypothetical protein
MSKCDLQILFDRPDRTYKLGEPMSGVIKLAAREDFQCRKITLIREWKTQGRGNRATGGGEGVIFAEEASFQSGEMKEYPFRFVGLAGPVSYQGHHLSVEWHLRAQVDIPLAVDVSHEEKFLLVPGETSEKILLGADEQTADTVDTGRALEERRGMAKVLAIPFFIIGLIMIAVSGWYPVALLLGLAAAGFGGWQIFFMLRNHLAQQKLGRIEAWVQPDKVRPGNAVECIVTMPSQHVLRLQKITATLKAEERVMSGSGNHKSTHAHTLLEQTSEQTSYNAVAQENKMQFTFSLPIPANAPSTFYAPDNALYWFIRVQIEIRDWPDWVEEFPVTVIP